jgi:hypothetical protein
MVALIAISSLFQGMLAAQNAPPRIEDVIRRYERGLKKIEGVREIAPDPASGVPTIMVRVETEEARDRVLFVTREKLEGYPVRILLSKTPNPERPDPAAPGSPGAPEEAACVHCPAHCPPPASPRAEAVPVQPPATGAAGTDAGRAPEAARASGTRIEDVIHRYEKGLKKIAGVREIAPDQVGGVPTITVRVETEDARDMVRFMTREKLDTYPVRILVSKVASPERANPAAPEETACARCPVHCPSPLSHRTEVEPEKTPVTGASKTGASPPSGPPKPAELCDVARKLQGLPPRKDGKSGCEEMVTTTNNPDRIRWAIDQGLPHWVSKEMPGVKGNAREGIACSQHGSHSFSEFVCYTWIRHTVTCPLTGKIAPKDLAPTPH